MQFAGKPATYKRRDQRAESRDKKHSELCTLNFDLAVIPIENVLERITFQINGFNMSRDSCMFLLAMPPCGEPKEGDVISFLIGETVDEYEVTGDEDGNWIEPFGMNKVGMIVHTKKRG